MELNSNHVIALTLIRAQGLAQHLGSSWLSFNKLLVYYIAVARFGDNVDEWIVLT